MMKRISFTLLIVFVVFSLSESAAINSFRPSRRDHAGMARYLVHKSNWTSMGSTSIAPKFKGYPFVNVKSVADSGVGEKSTGKIYFMLTNLDFTGKDLTANNTLTALFTEDQDLSCSMRNVDTMEPTCARVFFTGSMKKLEKQTEEHEKADRSFISRHPAAKKWKEMHDFYLCKLEIDQVIVIDFYGGAHYVSKEDYYNANYDSDDYEFEDFIPTVLTPN